MEDSPVTIKTTRVIRTDAEKAEIKRVRKRVWYANNRELQLQRVKDCYLKNREAKLETLRLYRIYTRTRIAQLEAEVKNLQQSQSEPNIVTE